MSGGQSVENDYPPTCGCGGPMQPMASNGSGSFVVMICPTCDGDTLDAMWDYETRTGANTALRCDDCQRWAGHLNDVPCNPPEDGIECVVCDRCAAARGVVTPPGAPQ